jgi:AcrR family transcriptional regulator
MKSALRQNILKVARALFMEKGFEAVGMREIAQAVGLQPTQVYRLELSKADILAEVIIELNNELIQGLPALLATIGGDNAFERTSAYLHALYRFDIEHQPLRSVGAIYGWSWTGEYETAVIAQVWQFLSPIANWLRDDGFEDIQARCYGVWALYYVGYRRAVLKGCAAGDCLAEIRPSLALLFDHGKRTCPPSPVAPHAGATDSGRPLLNGCQLQGIH